MRNEKEKWDGSILEEDGKGLMRDCFGTTSLAMTEERRAEK